MPIPATDDCIVTTLFNTKNAIAPDTFQPTMIIYYDPQVSAGWFMYNGVAIRFPAQSYTAPVASGDAAYIVVSPTAAPLEFNDTSTPDVILDSTGVLTILPATTATDSTHFLLSALAPFGREAAYTSLSVLIDGPGSAVTSGYIYYKKNFLNNTLQGFITLSISSPSAFVSLPYFNIVTIATLPMNYRPQSNAAYFTGTTTLIVPYSTGSGNFNTISGFVNTDGTVNMLLINSSTGTYGANLSFIVSLD